MPEDAILSLCVSTVMEVEEGITKSPHDDRAYRLDRSSSCKLTTPLYKDNNSDIVLTQDLGHDIVFVMGLLHIGLGWYMVCILYVWWFVGI